MTTITDEVLRVGDWGTDLKPTFERLGYGFEPNVTKLEVVIGRSLGLAFFLWEERTRRWWSCYYNQAAGDMHCDEDDSDQWRAECWKFWTGIVPEPIPTKYCPCEQCWAQDDPITWIEGLWGATDWGAWEWEPYEELPIVY